MHKKFVLPGYNLELSVGEFARQASGSAWLKCGDNVVLATTTVGESLENLGFFPLSVEFRKRFSAVGKIPGGYIKREGKLSDAEVLISRIIDRSLRPLFSKSFLNDTQVIVNLLSYDGSIPLEVFGILSASISTLLSGAPVFGPVGAVVYSRKKDGQWQKNPDYAFVKDSSDQVLIVGTENGICMVEASCDFISEEELLKLVESAEVEIKTLIDWQKKIAQDLNITVDQKLLDKEKKIDQLVAKVSDSIKSIENWESFLLADDKSSISDNMKKIKEQVKLKFAKDLESEEISEADFGTCYEIASKKVFPTAVFKNGKRFDGRDFDQVRSIDCKIDLLPKSHGSAVFTRGQTQALSTTTLGSLSDVQKVDTIMQGTLEKSFLLHYNFPPYSTGEVRPLRGVGRREIGHGYLAEKSFKYALPLQKDFPYTIRSLVDVLESNGSSSMATVCATTLALLDAGVPLKKNVTGVAMGLLVDENKNFMILSDLTGTEDAFGIMDLKVTGDQNVTAIQMDIKSDEGLPKDIIVKALVQAKNARVHILNEMNKAISSPRKELKEFAPRVACIKINPKKIGSIIGPGGKNIKAITAETGSQISVEDDGRVMIYSSDALSARRAEKWVRALSGEIKVGSSYSGKVAKVSEFGIFVSIIPGKDGLVKKSSIDPIKWSKINDHCKQNDSIDVVVVSVENDGDRISLVSPELESSESFDS